MAETKTREPKYTGPITLEGVSEEPDVQLRRTSLVDLSEFRAIVARSANRLNDKGRGLVVGVTVPTAAVKSFTTRFRAAAREMGFGLVTGTVTFDSPEAKPEYGLDKDGSKTRIQLQVKPKKAANGTAAKPAPAPAPAASGLPKPLSRKRS